MFEECLVLSSVFNKIEDYMNNLSMILYIHFKMAVKQLRVALNMKP